jgi:glycyl-tRNA synthetase beta chain
VKDFVLEIGAENIPASYVEPAFRQLADDAEALFGELRLPWEEIYATGTPRRITLLVGGLAERQETAEETVTGPPVSKAFDEDGTPTKAAEGFARSQGVAVSDLRSIETPKGEYLGFRRRLESRSTTELLAGRLSGLIRDLRFPKVMKWEPSGAKFARPVRWIVCLYGGSTVEFTFAGVESGNVSYRRPWFAKERTRVRSAETYLADVAGLGIIVDDDTRRERIWSLAVKAASKDGLSPVEDEGLLDELTFMVEDPRVLTGEFPSEYLRLPPEVVTTAMRSHQRYIAVQDGQGRLMPKFITFTDGPVRGPAGVRRGNEKVLRARLEDAQFYWREDLKRGVDGLAAELSRIVFIEGLGTVGQKADRVRELARSVNDRLEEGSRLPADQIDRAAELAKADLASEMIKDGKEFTLLQGLIGSHYARECGEAPAVVDAVEQHYRPRHPADPVPASELGAVIGVADRMDTICGCFIAGLVPSGSQDPYALRRQANGLIRIVETKPSIRIDELIRRSVDSYVEAGLADRAAAGGVVSALDSFFEARCAAFLKDKGIAYDVVNAVSRVSWRRPGVALARAEEIARYRGDKVFERLITGVKRVGNILSEDKRLYGVKWDAIERAFGPSTELSGEIRYSTDRFEDPAERQLYDAVTSVVPEMIEADNSHDIAAILNTLSRLADPIDRYFERVLVNCEDPDLRDNRHHFLSSIFVIFSRYADFSYIVEDGSP